ncbi:MAG: sugar ABC transporter permease [Chloroflexaceae bacterium]|nr:sugar ABC transporter permease [Chloroflexaceae bacterium]
MARVAARPKTVSPGEWRERLLFIAFLGPNLLLFCVFTFWPLLYNFYLSFVNWNFIRPRMRWVWFDNYVAVFSSSQFWVIFWNTLVFTFASVGLTLLLGLALALLINQPLKGRNVARAVLFSPVILSGAAIAVVWAYIFDPRYGLLNELLMLIGLRSPDWLVDPFWAMPAVIIVYVWKNLGYAVVIYLAGLPPVAFFLSVTSILACFQAFDIIRVLTAGGPANATNTLIYHLYELGFVSYDAGRAGVVAMVLFGFMLILTLIQIRYLERRVAYS